MMQFRETILRSQGVEHVVRTEGTGTVKQLEAAHTKAVKATLLELKRETLPALRKAAEDAAAKAGHQTFGVEYHRAEALRVAVRRAEKGTITKFGTYDVATMRKPWPKVRFTTEVPEYLTEVEPGHWATPEVADEMQSAA
ncbi:hypothetical protein [Streptomyces sp. SM8]|jgi:hypothetical protein|uniref:hypothetical protein n=1 Tax=Streptomyces sp. SM8 TaxID=1195457 RepID=UPI0002831138|nr:hypothetical protein [Streptomyces sp. SM8]PKA37945.1 hypothetical protein SM8_029445 [Streptomyces sp. SM8]